MNKILSHTEAEKIFNTVYENIDGYEVSGRAREKHGMADPTLVYGEITFPAMEQLLARLALPPGKIFYDLGSGVGKAVILAALLGNFSKLMGVEIVEELVAAAETARRRLVIELEKNLLPGIARPQITFLNADIFTIDFSDADVVFIATTCFSDNMMSRLRRRLTMLKTGSTIITMTRTLQMSVFELKEYFMAPMNWGEATLCVYHKLR